MQPELRDAIVEVESFRLRLLAVEEALVGNIAGFQRESGDGSRAGRVTFSRELFEAEAAEPPAEATEPAAEETA